MNNINNNNTKIETPTEIRKKQESPWNNLIFNILLPVLILNKSANIGISSPLVALLIALSFPLIYGIWDYVSRKQKNYISLLGIISVLLSGGFAVLKLDGFWFVVKEASIPLMLGIFVLASAFSKKSIVRMIFFNPTVMNVDLIQEKLIERNEEQSFNLHLRNTTFILSGSLLLSAFLNYVVAVSVFKEIDKTLSANMQTQILNEQIAEMTWVSYLVIFLPSLLCMGVMLWYLFHGIKKYTGLKFEEVMHNIKVHPKEPKDSTHV